MNNEICFNDSVNKMTAAIAELLSGSGASVYLYGSAALGDFRFGWSDIDILVLTARPITDAAARSLVRLRRTLSEREPSNPYYRLFEGGMLPLSAFLTGTPDTVVYWGTSGERITDRYAFDSFCKQQLLDGGVLLYGPDVRASLPRPSYEDLRADVMRHYNTVRACGSNTGDSLYSFGWLLDISRCIYTLRTGKIIPKTKAGAWALNNGLCSDPAALKVALDVRRAPGRFREDEALRAYAAGLGGAVGAYADVLHTELGHQHIVLGEREAGVGYFDRPGAYLIAVQNGKLAVVRTKRGLFLPGGGPEDGESDADCIRREVLEETGCECGVGAFLGSAEHYTVHAANGPFHPIQSYYAGTVGEPSHAPTEPEHAFLRLPLQEIRGRLYPEVQNRALEIYCETEMEP